ncbi:alpha-L RNA-binding motif-containing protein [Choiromyces venosus 120613-1]|uniref:Alpha-L RNA-binding motif-containing protein n=1 Tax=Choiromyces venosus 120613-1 TaxID=1336337 RepID=A0A3N4J4E0_9PEZI|nr:alpha-L RNA-binding motif-containing protein [Choiromyces venosus 120613-1]
MRRKLNALRKPQFRQSWSKYALYNMSRAPQPRIPAQKTFFQQKWVAKAEVRHYHGEHLTNRQWQNIFRHTMKASVPMQNSQLALNNGGEMAMGRGSGLQGDEGYGRVRTVPYMSQLFWPMERRLDMAVHRAMFASSARQARQFVVHGFVKVNGKKMVHPGYMLNPGDMFSVDQDQALFATGQPKRSIKNAEGATETDAAAEGEVKAQGEGEGDKGKAEAKEGKEEAVEEAEAKSEGEEAEASSSESKQASTEGETEEEIKRREAKEKLKALKEDPNNLLDVTKPYATPWRPRDFMAPFAFIPRYLEVNHNTCHAVYLRHPVAKPGLAEAPSPYPEEILQMAFNWYLRRR